MSDPVESTGADNPESHSKIPYRHGRDLVPLRHQPRRFKSVHHERLFAREDALRARVDEVDQQLVELTTERRRLLDEIREVHDELRPTWDNARGRRRRHISHEEELPPTADQPTRLSGRELRAICLGFLRRARSALTLRQLHVLLHRAGYAIDHHLPTKVLADALGYEADHGRVRRLHRATYTLHAHPHEDDASPGDDADQTSTLPDW